MRRLPLVLPWQQVFRDGVAPQLSDRDLAALLAGLTGNDPELIQSATVKPFPSPENANLPPRGACLIGYALWHGQPIDWTVGELECGFAAVVGECDKRLGHPASIRPLTNYWDETPRHRARKALTREVRYELDRRRYPPIRPMRRA